jgi:hypothetical protein
MFISLLLFHATNGATAGKADMKQVAAVKGAAVLYDTAVGNRLYETIPSLQNRQGANAPQPSSDLGQPLARAFKNVTEATS